MVPVATMTPVTAMLHLVMVLVAHLIVTTVIVVARVCVAVGHVLVTFVVLVAHLTVALVMFVVIVVDLAVLDLVHLVMSDERRVGKNGVMRGARVGWAGVYVRETVVVHVS